MCIILMDVESQLMLDQECPICYYAITNNDRLEPCGHLIHSSCFLMTKNQLCPICRQVVKNPMYTPPHDLDYYIPPVSHEIVIALASVCTLYFLLVILYHHLH